MGTRRLVYGARVRHARCFVGRPAGARQLKRCQGALMIGQAPVCRLRTPQPAGRGDGHKEPRQDGRRNDECDVEAILDA